jgi:ribosomal protein L14E/L6E/L27E
MELKTGMLVESRAGHDKGELYIVTDMDSEFVYVCDGKIRTVDRPKKKKEKHVAKKSGVPEIIAEKLIDRKPVTNEDIKRVIKLWRSENV